MSLMPRPSPRAIRLLGLAALVGAIVGLTYWPFYSVAYHATPDGADSAGSAFVRAWSVPFREAVEPLVTFAEPQTVYLTWGKAFTLVSFGWLAGLVALRATHQGHGGKLARVAFPFASVATGLLAAASVVLYWTPFLDLGFMLFAIPGFLLSLVAYPLLGAAVLRAKRVPKAAGWLFIAGGPSILLLAGPLGSFSGSLSVLSLAWAVTGAHLRRAGPDAGAMAAPAAPEAS